MAEQRNHLFISYAAEDSIFATWLARKLACLGYAVWFDQLKMLGGEPWPQTIDEAIKSKTFRMLGLLSKDSISKPNPVKERILALEVSTQLSIPDFLVTLKLDDARLDWQSIDIAYIRFDQSWAHGLRQLLEKLESVDAPRVLTDGARLAAHTFPRGEDLIASIPERLIANVLRVQGVPPVIQGYEQSRSLTAEDLASLSEAWAHHRTASGDDLLALFPPPPNAQGIRRTQLRVDWLATERSANFDPRTVAATLVIETIRKSLRRAGFLPHPTRSDIVYLPETFSADGKLRFVGYGGKPTWLKIRGRATFLQAGHAKEVNFHHFALQLRLARGIDRYIWLQVRPTLFFFDDKGEPITDKRVGPRRRRLTKSWWNNKWVNRLLAAEMLFATMERDPNEPLSLVEGFERLESDVSVNEAALESVPDDSEESDTLSETPILIEPDETLDDGNADA